MRRHELQVDAPSRPACLVLLARVLQRQIAPSVLRIGFGIGSTRATWMATMDGTDSALCTVMAAIQDPAPTAPASACPQSSSTSAAPPSLILSRIRPQILAGEVGVTAGTRTGSLLAQSQAGATTQTMRGVEGSPSCSSPGALQARSRSAVAPDMAEQHGPGGHMMEHSVL